MSITKLEVSPEVVASGERLDGNGLLRELVTHIKRYNLLLPQTIHLKNANPKFVLGSNMVDLLDKISMAALAYLVYRPPGARKASGQAKWNSVAALRPQIAAHEEFFNIRGMGAQFGRDGVGEQPNYWLERLMTNSVVRDNDTEFSSAGNASSLSKAFNDWVGKSEKTGFLEFAETHYDHGAAGRATDSNMRYLTKLLQEAVEVKQVGTTLKMGAQDEPFDTQGQQTAASYSGLQNVYLYVCAARDQKVYSWRGTEGEFHHSSLARGTPVIAAGDWLVINGQVRFINAESGHYRPTASTMHLFATWHAKWWSPDTLVQPEHKGRVLRMRDFVAFGLKAKSAPRELVEGLRSLLGLRFSYRDAST